MAKQKITDIHEAAGEQVASNGAPEVGEALRALEDVRARAHKISVRQVERWYALLCDVGIDDAVTELLSQPSGMVSKADGTTVEMIPEVNVFEHVDVGALIKKMAREGLLTEMVGIICDLSSEEAANANMGVFMEQLTPFILASRMPIQALIGSVQNMA